MTTLYRAANDDSQNDTTSFAETLQAAEIYRSNPGFGGSTIWTAEAPSSSDRAVLDLVDADESEPTDDDDDRSDAYRALSTIVGRRLDVYSGELHDLVPRYSQDIRDAGYSWVLVPETYPANTTTWIHVGSSDVKMTAI